MEVKKWSAQWCGRELTVETGKLALQADASCVVRYGDTVFLATAVMSKNTADGIDFFPLSVSFEEKLYAAGKIKGSRFIKREGRPTDEAILSGRLVDRCIRPLFDESMRNEVQVILTALSVDNESDTQVTALLAASICLAISPIPWKGPIGGVRVSRVDGQWKVNPIVAEKEASDVDLLVSGTPDKLIMVEGECKEATEQDIVEAMKFGAKEIQQILDFCKQIQSEVGKEKINLKENLSEREIELNKTEEEVKGWVAEKAASWIFDVAKKGRAERVAMVDRFSKMIEEKLDEREADETIKKIILGRVKLYVEEHVSRYIIEKEQRLDGRGLDEVRELKIEVGLLPRTHGTGLFSRGDTQVLSVVTLGAPGDVQTLDSMEEEGTKRYMHHYNDTPATYGETGFMRGPGRRAIGHGALAEKALIPVLPSEEEFPYAIRVVSEVLGSNGSSSMASTCGSSLSLMDAGVPIKKPVAGIAMGLASDQNGNWKVITDLQDVEDGPGGMDFKITGTRDGVTAIQMDTKTEGLIWEIVEETFRCSKEARCKILDEMEKIIAEPRAEMSPYAPRITTVRIDPEKIREVIGPGGKVINKIIDETGVSIDIEDDGRVMITSTDAAMAKKAVDWVQSIVKEPEVGEVYEGKVVRLEDFGAFVEILPGKDGMVHVSEIDWRRVEKPSDVLNLGDTVKVKVKEIDNLGRVNLSMKVLKEKPEGYVEQPPRERRPFDRGHGQKKPFFKKR